MKKNRIPRLLVVMALSVLLAAMLSGCGADRAKQVVVFNFGDYIEKDVIAQFEEETGYEVLYDEFLTNEAMYAKLTAGAADYDLICASDYMIEKLIAEDRLLSINQDAVPNSANIDEKYWDFSRSFDPELAYSVPYFWGTVGILYDTTKVSEEEVQSWNVLWDEKYAGQIIMPNSIRDAFLVPLTLQDKSINTTDEAELQAAKELLIEQKPLVQAYLVDEARDEMIAGNAQLAVIYGSDAYIAHDYNENLGFCVPKEGSNLWLDSWVIPSTCQNQEGAQAFLDFICRDDIAMANFEYVYYATPNKAVYDALDEETKNDPFIFPPADVVANCEVFVNLDDATYGLYSTMWKEIKGE